jgi:hypothetical protein
VPLRLYLTGEGNGFSRADPEAMDFTARLKVVPSPPSPAHKEGFHWTSPYSCGLSASRSAIQYKVHRDLGLDFDRFTIQIIGSIFPLPNSIQRRVREQRRPAE